MIAREKIGGIIGTVIFTILLFLILLFSVFTLSFPPEEQVGIPVMFGTSEDAFGTAEPPTTKSPPIPAPSPAIPPYSPEAPLITQTTEPTIDVEAEREEERRKAQLVEERRAREEAERKRREEEARKREINQQMSGLFGESSGSRGNTEGNATQGVSAGNAIEGSSAGNGGTGSFDLDGRNLGKGGLIKPDYSVNDYGTVVVTIIVDPAGNVIRAEIGRGTTTGNTTLRNEALRAAKSTKFNAINAPNNQEGTITYRFNLN